MVATLITATQAFATPTAAADVVGGCTGYCPGTVTWYDTPGGVTTNVRCTAGRLTISPSASAMSGYPNGQYITYRYHLTNNRGYSGTSGWAAWTLAPASRYNQSVLVHTPRTALPATTFPVVTNTTWTVQVQYAWYTNQGTVYGGWAGPTSGYQWSGEQRYYTHCYT